MIDLYSFTTPNGYKASIMLEELALPYNVHVVDIRKDEQFKPEFLKISPNNKIPAIVDSEGPDGNPISVFESAAIVIYLAQKTKSPLLPTAPREFTKVMEWAFFQMASVGPMFGQMFHFAMAAKEKIPYAVDRYTNETKRILGVMDKQLGQSTYLAGGYSIADILTYPWVVTISNYMFKDMSPWPNVERWVKDVGARPAVQKGMNIPPRTA